MGVKVSDTDRLGSEWGQCEFRVIIRVRAELGLGLMFDPNNLLTLTIASKLTITLPLSHNLTKLDNERVGTRWKKNSHPGSIPGLAGDNY